MDMSRRGFLGCVAGAAATGLPLGRATGQRSSLGSPPRASVLDLGEHCGIRESLSGYRRALGTLSPCRDVLIVPGAVGIPPWAARRIAAALDEGATVILESGAGFASANEFRAHRSALDEYFQIHVEESVPLWPSRAMPYVDFSWPVPVRIRDFSRAIPLRAQRGKTIGRVESLPVALARQVGAGTLVFLGSPVGPALWAGDVEADRWLADIGG